MGVATREKLLACTRRRFRTEEIGGLEFTFQSLTESEKSKFEKQVLTKAGAVKDDSRRRLLVLSLVDGKSKQPFLEEADIVELGNLDGAVTTKLFDIAMEHVGFSDNDIEELEKNSSGTSAAGSPSD